MFDKKKNSAQPSNLSLEQLREALPRTPYDKANWLEDVFLKESKRP